MSAPLPGQPLQGTFEASLRAKRERALEVLGERWLLHPANRVQRLSRRQQARRKYLT